MSIVRWNLKEAGCQGEELWRANSRTDGQKSHSRPYRDGRVCLDRVIQQAIAQKLQSILEPLISESSYDYRPKRSAQQVIQKVKEYAEEGYRYAVSVDLSKYEFFQYFRLTL